MKLLFALAFLYAVVSTAAGDDLCPHDLQVKCITDVNHAYEICEKAAKEKGKDQQADIDCLQYFIFMEKDCWPCICQIAKENGWKIKGCPESHLQQDFIH